MAHLSRLFNRFCKFFNRKISWWTHLEITMVQNLKASCKITVTFQLAPNLRLWNSTIPRPPRFRTVLLAMISKFFSLQGFQFWTFICASLSRSIRSHCCQLWDARSELKILQSRAQSITTQRLTHTCSVGLSFLDKLGLQPRRDVTSPLLNSHFMVRCSLLTGPDFLF